MNESEGKPWPLAGRVAFRFLFSYLVLFFFPFPSGLVKPFWLGSTFDGVWEYVVPRFNDAFLHIEIPDLNNGGSGDSTFEYLRVLCMLVLSLVATLIWSIVDRRRTDYRTLHAWARIWLRYALALCMLTFGAVKVLMVQFESPGYGRLIQPLGEMSPMTLLWTFMGFSPSYTSFAGIVEVLAGVLLFFRRTTTLGALIVAGAMANVAMLNLSYDVPVKLGALHTLFLALVLLAPQAQRLIDFFVLNRATQPARLGPVYASARANRWSAMLRLVLVGSLLVYFSRDTYTTYLQHLATIQSNPTAPEGWYYVVSIEADGAAVPAPRLEEFRWKTISVRGGFVGVRTSDGQLRRFGAEGDPTKGAVTLYPLDQKNERIPDAAPIGSLELLVGDDGKGIIQGTFDGHAIAADLQRQNPADFPLMSRGFHWINEAPYFR